MKDAVATMGEILPEDAGGRDAVHVAVFSAVSQVTMRAGQEVAIVDKRCHDDRDTEVQPVGLRGTAVGIVDPFLKGIVVPGERFWTYLFPRTITALAHRWSHPAFEAVDSSYVPPSAKLESERWLRDWCSRNNVPPYEEVIGLASARADMRDDSFDDEGLLVRGSDASADIPPEFWDHVQRVIGRPIKGRRATYFTCSC